MYLYCVFQYGTARRTIVEVSSFVSTYPLTPVLQKTYCFGEGILLDELYITLYGIIILHTVKRVLFFISANTQRHKKTHCME